MHGSLDRSTAFLRAIRLLPDLDAIRYDRRGYGKSVEAGTCPVFSDQVDDLASVLAGEPAVLFGHSLGGVVVLAFAAHHPELAPAVIAYEAPMAWQPWWPTGSAGSTAMTESGDDAEAAERFMRRMVGDERWEALPPRTRDQRRAEGPALVAELRSIRPPGAAALRAGRAQGAGHRGAWERVPAAPPADGAGARCRGPPRGARRRPGGRPRGPPHPSGRGRRPAATRPRARPRLTVAHGRHDAPEQALSCSSRACSDAVSASWAATPSGVLRRLVSS